MICVLGSKKLELNKMEIKSTDKNSVKLSANDTVLGSQGLLVKRIQTCKKCGLSRDRKYLSQCVCVGKSADDRVKKAILIGVRCIKQDRCTDDGL